MLTTKRPTRTTVLYTVSTRSPAKTITQRLSKYAFLLFRIAVGGIIVAILLHDIGISPALGEMYMSDYLQQHLLWNLLSWPSTVLSSLLSTPWRLLLAAGVIWLIARKGYTEESLLIIRGLGVQTSTSSSSWLWYGGSTRFIPTNVIQDIFIHEAFKEFEVEPYLGIVIEGEEEIVVVFPSVMPRREILEQVWRGARNCLYEPKS